MRTGTVENVSMRSELGHLSNLVTRVAAVLMDVGGVSCRAVGHVLGCPGAMVPLPEIRIEGRGLLG